MNVSLAPTWRHAAVRSLMLCVALVLVAGVMYLMLGAPTAARIVRQNEIARFAPRGVVNALGEFMGQAGLVVLAAFIARRVVKVRL
jgi:membrane protein implicated in regulation of membrane protease activity